MVVWAGCYVPNIKLVTKASEVVRSKAKGHCQKWFSQPVQTSWRYCSTLLWQFLLSHSQGCHRWESQRSNQLSLRHVYLESQPNQCTGFPLDVLLRSVSLEVWASCRHAFGIHHTCEPCLWCRPVVLANRQSVLHVEALKWDLGVRHAGDWELQVSYL